MPFAPIGCSWLNMLERFFRDLTENHLRRGVFRSVEESIAASFDYIDHHNDVGMGRGYLRDKEYVRKTKARLLDALKAEQKDVHDCSKYPHLCTPGVRRSENSQ